MSAKIGVQFGYQGRYFKAIADTDKHYYDFYFIEGLLNVKNILKLNNNTSAYDLLLHGGFGYFQNHYYQKGTVHGVLGAINSFTLTEKFKIKLDIGAIVGWDIYQGNDDILPSLSVGLLYSFHKI